MNVHVPTLRATRTQLKSELDAILVVPTATKRDLTAAEERAFAEKRDAILEIDRNIADAEVAEQRRGRFDAVAAELGQTGEQRNPAARWYAGTDEVYRRAGAYSYFQDLAKSRLQPSPDVAERLNRHAQQMDRALAGGDVERRARKWSSAPFEDGVEYRVNPNRTDGQMGFFLPPLWLLEEYVDYARPARATADLMHPMTLPPGTDSINVPRIITPSKTDVQTADAATVASQDMTDDAISAPVRTIAGQQDVALQLLEQSPAGFDEIVFRDLQADYNQRLDIQAVSGTGANGQILGILNVSGINAVTFTQASPTLTLLWPVLMQAASKVANGIFMNPDAVAVTASRWFWAASQLDTAGRPLITGGDNGPFNSLGAMNPRAAQGAMGNLGGLPAVGDANIPNNLGAGTNEDRIIIARFDELYLFEGTPRIRILQEVLSGTLQVRFQLYNYVATMPQRRPKAISVISGTGVIAPAGF